MTVDRVTIDVSEFRDEWDDNETAKALRKLAHADPAGETYRAEIALEIARQIDATLGRNPRDDENRL
jgi:hypothetical protein